MASTSGKQKRNGSHSNQSRANKFFKIVTKPQDNKLKIPKSFIRKWGHNLPDKVTLKAPSGSIRQVELVNCDGETWFHKGWPEFKRFYSIELGSLLVFEYDGNSHFDVIIFDMTTMEIEYPIDNAKDQEGIKVHRAGSRMPIKEEYESESDANESESDENESESDDSLVILKDFRSKYKGKEKCKEVKGQQSRNRSRTTVYKESCLAYQRAKAFKSINPFYVHVMQPSYVFAIGVPFTFAREHLSETRNELRFWAHGDKTWNVWCVLGKKRATLTTGWHKFVKENALKVGDACVFEVNKGNKLLWNITIFHR